MTNQQITQAILAQPGITALNPMQQRMLLPLTAKTLLLAPTGSGKTLAFAIPLLRSLGRAGVGVQVLVIAPSRELALQIGLVVKPLAKGYKTAVVYGGHQVQEEARSLASQVPDILIATPGRLVDHLQRGHVSLNEVGLLVLDEFDKSLELGFEDDMRKAMRRLPSIKSVMMTSATPMAELPAFVPLRCKPEVIDFTVGASRHAVATVEVESLETDKLDTLVDLLRSLSQGKAIVFVNYRESADRVFKRLRSEGLPAGLYHGGLEQQQRNNAVDMLENGSTPIMVSTDLGSRGLDITGISHVIHYHLPVSPEAWTHRNGRTARQGREGTVYVIRNASDTIPEYVAFDRSFQPTGKVNPNPIRATAVTVYLNLGKKEKISRGDIVGWLIANAGLSAPEIGTINLRDHASLVAVPREKAADVLSAARSSRLKGQRVKTSVLKQ